jgi:DNA-binding response OmpR family regulator
MPVRGASVGRRLSRVRSARPGRLRIAAIDRDGEFLKVLAEHIERIGWSLQLHHAPVAHSQLLAGSPHVVVVEVGLLGPHWDEWLSRHPARFPQLGVIVCTGRSTAIQRVRGLRAGADDWIEKPCAPEELCARAQSIVRARRHGVRMFPTALWQGELELRSDLFDVLAKQHRAGLTAREFELLLHLAQHCGEMIERERLYYAVWGAAMARGDRSIDTFVRKIRGKLRLVSPSYRYIHTHKGVGYSFAAVVHGGRQAG